MVEILCIQAHYSLLERTTSGSRAG